MKQLNFFALLLLLPIGMVLAQNCTPQTPAFVEEFDTFPPVCWQFGSAGSINSSAASTSSLWVEEEFAHNFLSGGGSIDVLVTDSSPYQWIISPEFNLSAGGYEIDFDMAITAVDNEGVAQMDPDDAIYVAYSNDVGTSWNVLKTITQSNNIPNTREVITVDATSIVDSSVFIAIVTDAGSAASATDYEVHIDNFEIQTRRQCSEPSGVFIDEIFTDHVSVVFETTNVNATGNYEFALNTPGTGAPTGGTPVIRRGFESGLVQAGINTIIIGDGINGDAPLPPGTVYDLFLREECTPGVFSDWSVALTFRTLCDTVNDTFPLDVSFLSHTPDDCWRDAGRGNPIDGATGLGESQWRGGRGFTTSNGGVDVSNVVRLNAAENREWLISGVYDVTDSASDVLSVTVAVTAYRPTGISVTSEVATMGSDDVVQLVYREFSATPGPWQVLETWNINNSPAVTGATSFIDLSSISGLVEFAFYATDGDVDDAGVDLDFHVSQFFVARTASNPDTMNQPLARLYPNPVENRATLQLNTGFDNSMTIAITDINGRTLNNIPYETTGNTIELSQVEQLSSGLYFIKISSANATQTIKFIKK
ncbi:MAG: T9SS type A sorting domain-containing protein [Nonlabens sp.]